ncbi:hypothetical protein [Sulfitobacter sp. CW3]|uniref:hypothetical protein n=1 Tax=Sulfitobacter sp. CW3 TaxID=2861965 RepID=UPI001C5DD9F1|nr:hypothetical protein [Sulfitobacter sp. CW3]MBW4961767.1 hypothetical protein [Sulfitobacter sp. CW3]
MTTSCLSRRPSQKPNKVSAIRSLPLVPKQTHTGQKNLWTQDLSAAQNLVRSRQYRQALVLAAALKRLYGDRYELTQMITTCRGHLGASA